MVFLAMNELMSNWFLSFLVSRASVFGLLTLYAHYLDIVIMI